MKNILVVWVTNITFFARSESMVPWAIFLSIMILFHPKVKANSKLLSQLSQSCHLMILLKRMNVILGHRVEKTPRVNQMEEWEYGVSTKSHNFHRISINFYHKFCQQIVTGIGLWLLMNHLDFYSVLSGMDFTSEGHTFNTRMNIRNQWLHAQKWKCTALSLNNSARQFSIL